MSLEIESLELAYGKKTVIHSISAKFESCCIHGLVGLNGSGKTTLFNGLYGFIQPRKGTINWNGKPLQKEAIGFLETENFFYSRITGREYLSLFQLKNPDFKIESWNELFDLPLDRYIESYSTGMKKKLAFLGVLALDRELLLLDEPFNGLDIEAIEIMKIVFPKLIEQGKTIILSSHIMESLMQIADYITIINAGEVKMQESKIHFHLVHDYLHHLIADKADDTVDFIFGKK